MQRLYVTLILRKCIANEFTLLQDHEEAIVILIEGHCWDEALRLVRTYMYFNFLAR